MDEPAVVNYGPEPGAVELRDLAVLPPEEDEVLLDVGAVAAAQDLAISDASGEVRRVCCGDRLKPPHETDVQRLPGSGPLTGA